VAVASSGPFAYAVGGFPGSLEGFRIDPVDGSLSPLAGSPFPFTGRTPLTAAVGHAGRFLYVGNNVSQDISAYSIDPSSGNLTRVAGEPFPVTGVIGNGSMASSPSGNILYLATGAVTAALSVFLIDPASGELTHIPGSPFPAQPGPNALALDPLGRFLYVVNEQTEEISGYRTDPLSGDIEALPDFPVFDGPRPLSIALDPAGRFVFVGHAFGTVSAFSVDETTGALTAVPDSPFASGYQPNSLLVDPSGKALYVADPQGFDPPFGSGGVWAHLIDPATGMLSVVSGSPFEAGTSPWSLASFDVPTVNPYLCDLRLEYGKGVLTMGFELATSTKPVDWNLFVTVLNKIGPIWSGVTIHVARPIQFDLLVENFPRIGKIGVLTTLADEDVGIVCSDFEVVDTGLAEATLTTEGVRELTVRRGRIRMR
jgi:6-phosphogluconolactonase (cycloisomerase 2 family)